MSTETDYSAVAAADARYTFDVAKLDELRKSSPWRDDARYFKAVAIGPSAVMKMVSRNYFLIKNDGSPFLSDRVDVAKIGRG
jgi:hypothetical protein